MLSRKRRELHMAQEDKGLVARGMFLLAVIGALVTFVLAVLFWRRPAPPAAGERRPETCTAQVLAPPGQAFPSHVRWPTVFKLSEALPRDPGGEIRYNAAATLARR